MATLKKRNSVQKQDSSLESNYLYYLCFEWSKPHMYNTRVKTRLLKTSATVNLGLQKIFGD